MDYYFHNFLQSDIKRCAQLSGESWPAIFKLTDKDNAYKFMELYPERCLLDSDYEEVCCDDQNNAIGLIFGAILPRKSLKKEVVNSFDQLPSLYYFNYGHKIRLRSLYATD